MHSTVQKASDYIYTISVQGHGKYPTEQVIENPASHGDAVPDSEEQRWTYEYYANQVYEMDLFVKELTDTLAIMMRTSCWSCTAITCRHWI